jgi:hypothetical protein
MVTDHISDEAGVASRNIIVVNNTGYHGISL